MGTCLTKIKRNKVGHSPREKEIRKRTDASPVKTKKIKPLDTREMEKQLKEAEAEEVRMTKGGVAFTLDPTEGDPCRMPSRLADRLDGSVTPPENNNEIKYTSEEKEILAELMREDILRERSVKARREIQAYDAARRRAAFNT